jgi:uncharacterized protein (TIGR00661 family)
MKVLYGIQATGNGHLTRAREIIPELRKKVEVDVLVSGNQTELSLPFDLKYQFDGFGFYFGNKGGIDLVRTLKNNHLGRFLAEMRSLNLESYDIVITDFEPISAWAALLQGKYSVGIGNQYALRSPWVAKPTSLDLLGKLVIRHYAPAKFHYGLHYTSRHESVFKPIIRKEIRELEPEMSGHYLVYLPSFSDERIIAFLSQFESTNWVVFSKKSSKAYRVQNIQIHPISEQLFIQTLSDANGVFCNAGFGLTTEAIYLQKKLIVLPMKMQYEQQCNAFSLKQLGVPVVQQLDEQAARQMRAWLASAHYINVYYTAQAPVLVNIILEDYIQYSSSAVNSMGRRLRAARF